MTHKARVKQRALINQALTAVIQKTRVAVSSVSMAVLNRLQGNRSEGDKIPRQLFSFETMCSGFTENFFARLYRIPKPLFYSLARKIQNYDGPRRSHKISPLLRLSVTIRWLAGGSYLDIAANHHITVSSVFYCIRITIGHLLKELQLDFPYDDKDWLEVSAKGFTRNGRSPLDGCCAALDGIANKIKEPAEEDVPNPGTYFNRKVFFAIIVQAFCDSSYRFLFLSAITPGSSHDSKAFCMSSLSDILSRNTDTLLDGYWIAADDAYQCTIRFICPWPGRNISVEKNCFNYWQSSAGIFIEQAFGILVMRWGIFWRPIRTTVGYSSRIALVCALLHNYIIDQTADISVPTTVGLDFQRHCLQGDKEFHLQDDCDTDDEVHRRRKDLDVSQVRDMFTERIKDEGLQLPRIY